MSSAAAAATSWHDAFVLPYTGYLRVYEPLAAFPAAQARHWAGYAASADRPRRAGALAAEQADALRRLIATPPVVAPEQESDDAYVRWSEGITYICPWQTRLRSWLALGSLRESAPHLLSAAFPAANAEAAASAFSRWPAMEESLRVHIQASTWSVPHEWFVPFAPDERWLVLGPDGEAAESGEGGRATATRALVYATTMAQARRRVARALGASRRAEGIPVSGRLCGGAPPRMLAGLEPIGRWLEEFHPYALVELDYGGLVHLFSDEALRADQSVAEVAATVSALGMNEVQLAIAMHRRVTRRWQALEARSHAS